MSEIDSGEHKDLHERLLDFAARVGLMYTQLPKSRLADVYGLQVVRSSSSVGAQLREAKRARSDAEFVSKCESSQQELDETTYWFELMVRTKLVTQKQMVALLSEAEELMSIIASWAINAKKRR